MTKYKLIALFGQAGAGKDTIQKYMVSSRLGILNEIVSCTTRPPREYEKDGVDYHFLTNEQFAEKVMNLSMLEATSFNGWHYGTPIESLNPDYINIGVFNITGIDCLLQDSRLEVYPILVYASDKQRLLRQLNREENPNCAEIVRRFKTDAEDFLDIPFEYMVLDNDATDKAICTITAPIDKLVDSLIRELYKDKND